MSTMRINFVSKQLSRAVNVSVILPIENEVPQDGYKTLYLLNGYLGDDLDWLHQTRIKNIAMESNIAVVMPAGENGFYVDDSHSRRNYSQFIGSELVEVTRKMFPLSTKREDTYIAGLSMGGFGALYNGIRFNDTFSKIGAFSFALVNEIRQDGSDEELEYIRAVFGLDISEIRESDKDPRYLIENIKGGIPQMYIACGSEDFVLPGNDKMNQFLIKHNIDHKYIVEPGDHDWDFWNKHIELYIKWLDL